MKPMSYAISAALLAVIIPTSAFASFRSINRQTVNVINPVTFEVVGRTGARPEDYWCAAGDFAQRKLRVPWQSNLYVVSPRGQSMTTNRRSAVKFTTDPQAEGVTPINQTISIGAGSLKTGVERTVTAAYGSCEDVRIPFNDF